MAWRTCAIRPFISAVSQIAINNVLELIFASIFRPHETTSTVGPLGVQFSFTARRHLLLDSVSLLRRHCSSLCPPPLDLISLIQLLPDPLTASSTIAARYLDLRKCHHAQNDIATNPHPHPHPRLKLSHLPHYPLIPCPCLSASPAALFISLVRLHSPPPLPLSCTVVVREIGRAHV